MRLITNKTGGEVVLHFNLAAAGSETITIAGNNSVSNVATADETVNAAYITQIFFGSASAIDGYWLVKRGANTVAMLDSTGWHDYAGNGAALRLDETADLTAELVGTAPGFLVIEMQKKSDIANNDYLVG